MSTQNVVTVTNLPTDIILAQSFKTESVKLFKKLKYEVGCVDINKMRDMLRLSRFVCSGICYMSDEDDRVIRENLIREAINEIYEL